MSIRHLVKQGFSRTYVVQEVTLVTLAAGNAPGAALLVGIRAALLGAALAAPVPVRVFLITSELAEFPDLCCSLCRRDGHPYRAVVALLSLGVAAVAAVVVVLLVGRGGSQDALDQEEGDGSDELHCESELKWIGKSEMTERC